MPRKPIPDQEKYCERCGKPMQRKRYNERLEDKGVFARRRYCSLLCANSRGVRSQKLKQQHKISQRSRKERCEQCGRRPNNLQHLHVHHINGDWKDHSKENLKTLCVGCHLKLHTKPAAKCHVCGKQAKRNRMCSKHFQRWEKYGDPLLTKKNTGSNGWQIVKVGLEA